MPRRIPLDFRSANDLKGWARCATISWDGAASPEDIYDPIRHVHLDRRLRAGDRHHASDSRALQVGGILGRAVEYSWWSGGAQRHHATGARRGGSTRTAETSERSETGDHDIRVKGLRGRDQWSAAGGRFPRR